MSNISKANITAAKKWLDKNYPTYGDGVWSVDFIHEVAQGLHKDHENAQRVLLALQLTSDINEPSIMETYDIAQVVVEDAEIFFYDTLAFGLNKAQMLEKVAALKADGINFQVFKATEEGPHQLVISHINLINP